MRYDGGFESLFCVLRNQYYLGRSRSSDVALNQDRPPDSGSRRIRQSLFLGFEREGKVLIFQGGPILRTHRALMFDRGHPLSLRSCSRLGGKEDRCEY